MKVSKVELIDYLQFKNLTLNLTYPKGHKKAGEPLDKICIIGQSGTGKTNLLKVIRDRLYSNSVKTTIGKDDNSDSEKIYFSNINKDSIKNNNFTDNLTLDKIKDLLLYVLPFFLLYVFVYLLVLLISNDVLELLKPLEQLGIVLLKLLGSVGLILSLFVVFLIFVALALAFIKKLTQNKYKIIEYKHIYIELDEYAWFLLKEKIDNYAKEDEKIESKLFKEIKNKSKNIEQAMKEKEEWESKNENILKNISDKLNTILNKLNLELYEINKNTKEYNDLIFKDLSNDKIIKYDNLSTGTKNIISTFIPLKIHNPKDSIILIDEPENSFYPDIQQKLTELYMEVGENNQLIMATHSPLIASSFEPWEVVELKFDEDNQVYRELYYPIEEENHIDNYTLDPRMLTWTSILTRIFDMKEDSNFDFREKKLMEYIRLENELHNIKDKKEKMQKFEELMKLSELLGLSDNEKN